MAELKNTIVNGVLNVNGDLIASKIIKRGDAGGILRGNGSVIAMGTGNSKFLREDGVWESVSTSDTGATDIEVTGTGNAVTKASYDTVSRKITLTKELTFLTAESDTLQSVTNRGATTTKAIGVAGLTSTGNVVLHNSAGGDSPKLVFQRGDEKGTITDWNMYVKEGILKINSVHTSNSTAERNIADFAYTGGMTIHSPSDSSGVEITSMTIKTSNGGQLIIGKEGPNSGTMLRFDQAAGTTRLRFRASSTAGAMVWEQPESNSSLYLDVSNVDFRNTTGIKLSQFKSAGYLYTDSSGNLKSAAFPTIPTVPNITITDTTDATTKPIVGDITADGHTITVSRLGIDDLGLASAYKYKGTLANLAAIEAVSNPAVGDVYNAEDTGMNYAWNGSVWDALGSTVDLSNYITGSGTQYYIPRFGEGGKSLGNSELIDNGSNIYPNANLGSALGHTNYMWDKVFVRQIELNREKGVNYGRISFYKPTMYTWFEYMSPKDVKSPTGANTIDYGEVSSWARRSLIEPNNGYGWIWEAASNSENAAPEGRMALSSTTGNLKVAGSVTANGFIHGGLTAATGKTKDDYVLLAGGSTKPISDFTTGGGSIGDYVTKSTNQTITGIKTFSHSTFGAIILKRDGSTNAASIAFQNNNGTLGYVGMTNAANGGLQRWTADTTQVYTVWDSGNDGSGSGLDADKLDGQEGSYYYPANYYWANVAVSSTSSTATTPSVQKIGITGSTTTTAAAAVTMEYDSGYKALKFVFA